MRPPLYALKIELSRANRGRFVGVFYTKVMAQIIRHTIQEPKNFAVRVAALICCHTFPYILQAA